MRGPPGDPPPVSKRQGEAQEAPASRAALSGCPVSLLRAPDSARPRPRQRMRYAAMTQGLGTSGEMRDEPVRAARNSARNSGADCAENGTRASSRASRAWNVATPLDLDLVAKTAQRILRRGREPSSVGAPIPGPAVVDPRPSSGDSASMMAQARPFPSMFSNGCPMEAVPPYCSSPPESAKALLRFCRFC